jgi:hypothetical protein
MFEAEFVSKSDQTETASNGEQAPMVYPGKRVITFWPQQV